PNPRNLPARHEGDLGRLELCAMANRGPGARLKYGRMIGAEQLSDAEAQDAEDLLARLVGSGVPARPPELFGRVSHRGQSRQKPTASSGAAIIALRPNGSPVN